MAVDGNRDYAVGVDIGGTKTMAALIDDGGTAVRTLEFPTLPERGADDALARIRDAVHGFQAEADRAGGRIRGIGVASAGVVDPQLASIAYAGNLGWRDVQVGRVLEGATGLPVRLGNDGNLAAVAEFVWGTGRRVKDLIYITVSTGIGAGIVSGGRLVEGTAAGAGEFGHITVHPFGPRCGCGNVGCLENYSSGTAIAAEAALRLPERPDGRSWTSRDVLEAASSGDAAAADIVRTAGFYLGIGLTTLIHLFNPERIVLGGGVTESGGLLLEEAERFVDAHCLPDMRKHVAILRTQLGRSIGVLGAAGQFFMEESRP